MNRIPVNFSAQFDIYFADEIVHTASGTCPNIRGTVGLRNAEVKDSKITPELQAECLAAWEEDRLEQFVRSNFFPIGRAENARFWAIDEDDEC